MPSDDLVKYWERHYTELSKDREPSQARWLDYSNERVQIQTLFGALEAAGPLYNRVCLDVGCGWGQLSLIMHAMGAEVVAIDMVEQVINDLKKRQPSVNWFSGNFLEMGGILAKFSFDLIMAVEVLQYVEFGTALHVLWTHLKPGGRLVGIIPNSKCPIIQNAMKRFDGRYLAEEPANILKQLGGLASIGHHCIKGFIFRQDQTLWPYEATSWQTDARSLSGTPNRILFIAQKKCE